MIIIFYFSAFLVIVIAIFYCFGYGYLFNGISKTYLKGKSSANIDDGKYFKSNVIHTSSPKLWEEAPNYNAQPLPKNILDDLKQSNTASFVVVKNGKLLHEE